MENKVRKIFNTLDLQGFHVWESFKRHKETIVKSLLDK